MAKKPPTPGPRRTLEQWKSVVWKSRMEAERVLQRSGVPLRGADYALGESAPGVWMLLDRRDETSQEASQAPPSEPQASPEAARTEAGSSERAPPAASPAAPQASSGHWFRKVGSRDPAPEELSEAFDDWAVEMCLRPDCLQRIELRTKTGLDRRWQHYLKALAERRGLRFEIKRTGRFTRFCMIQP